MSRGKKAILISIKPEWVEKILNGEKTIEIRKSMPKCDLPIDVYIYCTKGNVNFYKLIRENYIYFSGAVAEPFDTQIGFSLTKEKLAKKYRDNIEDGFSDIFTNLLNGKIVAKFTLNKVDKYRTAYVNPKSNQLYRFTKYGLFINEDKVDYTSWEKNENVEELLKKSCLNANDVHKYAKTGKLEDLDYGYFYAWHIDDLKIFQKPMELTDFYKNNWEYLSEQYCEDHNCRFAHENSVLGDDGYCPIDECPRLRVNKPPQSWQYVFVEDEDEKTN